LSEALTGLGHEVDIVAYGGGALKVPSHNFGIHTLPLWPLPAARYLQWGLDAARYVGRLTENENYDIIHAHNTAMAFPLLYRAKVPLVMTCHVTSRDPANNVIARTLLRASERSYYAKATTTIAISKQVRHELIASNVDPDRVVVIPNGSRLERFAGRSETRGAFRQSLGIRDDEIAFLYVGSLTKRKGFDMLMKAAESLLAEEPHAKFRLIVVGVGPLLKLGLRTAERCRSVCILRYVPEQVLASLYTASDVFVIPSVYEGMPTVLLDALLWGLPVLASDIPVHREVLSSEAAHFVKTGNPASLRDGLLGCVRGELDLKRMGSSARQLSHDYLWNTLVNRVIRVYEMAMESLP